MYETHYIQIGHIYDDFKLKKTFVLHSLYKNNSALQGLKYNPI